MYIVRNKAKKPTLFLGLASEGMGHATRARTLINQLQSTYDVHVFCGGRVYDYLAQHHKNVHAIGLSPFSTETTSLNWASPCGKASKASPD